MVSRIRFVTCPLTARWFAEQISKVYDIDNLMYRMGITSRTLQEDEGTVWSICIASAVRQQG